MKNRHLVNGSTVVIFVPYRGTVAEVLIDLVDLPRVARLPAWRLNRGRSTPYVVSNDPKGPRGSKVWLHKLILKAGPDVVVDHINFIGTDCRRQNLRKATHSTNGLRRSAANSNNRGSGIRGVLFRPTIGKFEAHVTVGYVKRSLGIYDTKEEAREAVRVALAALGVPDDPVSAAEKKAAAAAKVFARSMSAESAAVAMAPLRATGGGR